MTSRSTASDAEKRMESLLASWNMQATREYEFCPDRKFRLDFAWPYIRLGLEIQGGVFMRGRSGHTSMRGIKADHDKANIAALLGWSILYVDTSLLPAKPHAEKEAYLYELVTQACNRQYALAGSNEVFDLCNPFSGSPVRPARPKD